MSYFVVVVPVSYNNRNNESSTFSLSNNVGKATIELVGVVLDCKPYKIVMELMKGGNLLNFLRSSRPNDVRNDVKII